MLCLRVFKEFVYGLHVHFTGHSNFYLYCSLSLTNLSFDAVLFNSTSDGMAIDGPDNTLSLTCTAYFEHLQVGNFSVNSIGWYRNGQRLTNTPDQYNINVTSLTRPACYYNGSQYVCHSDVLYAIQVVLDFDNLMLSDAGEYICMINITDFRYDRTVLNTTTETVNVLCKYSIFSNALILLVIIQTVPYQ